MRTCNHCVYESIRRNTRKDYRLVEARPGKRGFDGSGPRKFFHRSNVKSRFQWPHGRRSRSAKLYRARIPYSRAVEELRRRPDATTCCLRLFLFGSSLAKPGGSSLLQSGERLRSRSCYQKNAGNQPSAHVWKERV